MLHDGLLGRRLIFNSGGVAISATIVQSMAVNGTGNPSGGHTLASPVTAGNLLVMLAHKFNPAGSSPSEVALNDGTTARPFTLFSGSPFYQHGAGDNYYDTRFAYRVASGDEQTLKIVNQAPGSDWYYMLYEIANAGDPTTFEVITASAQAAATSKVIGTLSAPGALQLMALTYGIAAGGDRPLDQSVGSGWTQDVQDGKATGGSNYILNYGVAHATNGATAQWSGGSVIWGGCTIGIKGRVI